MKPVLRYPTSTDDEREKAVAIASLSIQRGELVVIPTDTVYGLAADAFDSDAVNDLLAAKGRGRDMPPPVLVSSATTLDALAVRVPEYVRALVAEFWPGPLTLVCHQQTSLQWDLGDTRGTVAVRMPDHPIALEILERTGPLAVSSANLTGSPAATDAVEAEEMLGEKVAAIVDAGPSAGAQASTIIDATGPAPRVLREGVISRTQLDAVLGPLGLALSGEPGEPGEPDVAATISLDKEPEATSTVALEKTPKDATSPVTTKTRTVRKKPAATQAPVDPETPLVEATQPGQEPVARAADPAPAAPAAPATPVRTTIRKKPVRRTTIVMPAPTDPSDPV